MVVAKRQRKGKALENGTKEYPGTGVRTLDATNTPPSWLAHLHRAGSAGRRQMNKWRNKAKKD